MPLHDWLTDAQASLERQRAAAQTRHTHPPEQAGPLLAFLIPATCAIWVIAWLLADWAAWVTLPLATAATVFIFRCLPAPFIPLHVQVVPQLGNRILVVWLWVGWAGMLWILLG